MVVGVYEDVKIIVDSADDTDVVINNNLVGIINVNVVRCVVKVNNMSNQPVISDI